MLLWLVSRRGHAAIPPKINDADRVERNDGYQYIRQSRQLTPGEFSLQTNGFPNAQHQGWNAATRLRFAPEVSGGSGHTKTFTIPCEFCESTMDRFANILR